MYLPKSPILVIGLIAVIVGGSIFGISTVLTYNSLVSKQQGVQAQWAQVENQYQRKIDLIPELVSAVNSSAHFEQSTLENITALRSQWLSSSGMLDQRINTTNAIDQILVGMRATYEAYPDLQTPGLIHDLMYSLEGTENRVAVERMRFNDLVRDYNTQVHTFPSSVVASWFGFHETRYYDPIPGGPP